MRTMICSRRGLDGPDGWVGDRAEEEKGDGVGCMLVVAR